MMMMVVVVVVVVEEEEEEEEKETTGLFYSCHYSNEESEVQRGRVGEDP